MRSVNAAPERPSVVVAGGGIAGLYAAYLLGRLGHDVQVFELDDRWGGRIDSRPFGSDGSDGRAPFIAEFGPMRFEPDLQVRLRRLCFHLGIAFASFSPTTAPPSTTHYDLTTVEASLEVADLLKWAVLRMFFERDVKPALEAIERSGGRRVGPRQLAELTRHMDATYFCDVRDDGGTVSVAARPDETVQANVERLRRSARLRGSTDGPLLAEMGLWNALSEILTPGAIARIRDNGTFYHLIGQNPSAFEWGLFWLRQASILGELFHFDRRSAPHGTHSLVRELVSRIRTSCPTVRLSLGNEVVRVEHGKRPDEVVLRVTCHDETGDSYSFNQRADHVVLALPQQPLRTLAEHFPTEVQTRLERVAPLPLLKAFLVTRRPWWRPHLTAQTFAWLVPTRELHFFRDVADGCPAHRAGHDSCTCEEDGTRSGDGMIMLYTDHPAIAYWRSLMSPEERRRTTWTVFDGRRTARAQVEADPDGLLAVLVRRLMMIPDPGLAQRIMLGRKRFTSALRRAGCVELAAGVRDASTALELARCVVDGTRTRGEQAKVRKALRGAGVHTASDDDGWRESLDFTIRSVDFALDPAAETVTHADDVLAWGIRDWSAAPFGGAAHFWLPRRPAGRSPARAKHEPQPPQDPLIAFSLRGRAKDGHVENVHVCGEAYSDFQGFIEGALRTAEQVVASIAGGDPATWVFSKDGPSDLERRWVAGQPRELARRWNKLR